MRVNSITHTRNLPRTKGSTHNSWIDLKPKDGSLVYHNNSQLT